MPHRFVIDRQGHGQTMERSSSMNITTIDTDCLIQDLKAPPGNDYNRCYHCSCCGNGCPFIKAMDYPPNAVIRLLQYGMVDEALASSTIWICVACNTCAMQCPMSIDIPGLMDDLRHLALAKGAPVAEPDVLKFHQTVLDSISRYGRTHKLDIMMRFKLSTRRWLQDWHVGLKMLAKRKLDLMPSKVKQMDKVKSFFNSPNKDKHHG
jgi:heterodisulfide reductase subunit C